MVSGEAPSKNLARAIAAYARYRELCGEPSLLLKIAGVKVQFHSGFRALAKRVGVADHIEFLEYLPPDQMRHLYSNAALFVLPSLVEGFGIPVLEAMASGTPVVASRSASLLEVGGAAARYFDPHSIEDIAKTMRDVLANPALLLEMSELGRHQVRGFHPDIVSETVRRFWHSRLGRASESAIDSIPVVP
jgi:glycosyltransferase involved in cell wall biosynthesis